MRIGLFFFAVFSGVGADFFDQADESLKQDIFSMQRLIDFYMAIWYTVLKKHKR